MIIGLAMFHALIELVGLFVWVFIVGWFEKLAQMWNPSFYIILNEDNLFKIDKIIK
jgi:hypothetical protein